MWRQGVCGERGVVDTSQGPVADTHVSMGVVVLVRPH